MAVDRITEETEVPSPMVRAFNGVMVALAFGVVAMVAAGGVLFAWLLLAFLAQAVGLVDDGESLLWCGHVFVCEPPLMRFDKALERALRAAGETPPLEQGAELHSYVRRPPKGNGSPPAFVAARGRVDALEGALRAARADLQGLVREAYAQGVPRPTLARWSGYHPNWISRVLREDGPAM